VVTAGRHVTPRSARTFPSGAITPLAAVGVVTPGLTYLLTQIVLSAIALARMLSGETAPLEDDLMRTSVGWPPFIAPSWPFWASLPLLLGMAALSVWRPAMLGHAFRPGFVAFFLATSGCWALLFAHSFLATPAWPRDSALAGALLLGASAAVTLVALGRLVLSLTCRRRPGRTGGPERAQGEHLETGP
jgi:hypothetical protein